MAANSYAELGNTHLKAHRWQEAIACLLQALQEQPNRWWLYHQLGEAYMHLQQWQEAVDAYRRAIRLNSQFCWSYHRLADAWLHLKKPESAIAAYHRAIFLHPDFVWSYYNLGQAYEQLQQWQKAAICYLHATAKQDQLPDIIPKLGRTLQRSQQGVQTTVRIYRDWFHPDFGDFPHLPEQPKFYQQLARDLAAAGYLQAAIALYNVALSLLPEYPEIAHQLQQELSQVSQQQKEVDQQIAALSVDIEQKPDNPWPYYQLGLLYRHQHQLRNAAIAFQKSLQIRPDLPWWFYTNLWETLAEANSLEPAIQLFRSQLQNPIYSLPTYCTLSLNLAEALTQQGNLSDAIAYHQSVCYRQTLTIHPHFVRNFWQEDTEPAPHFLIVGAQRSGTTSLYSYLSQHPHIIPAIKKELDFFSWRFPLGMAWYRSHFPPIPDGVGYITGEASPSYLTHSQAAERLFQFYPNIQLIVLLRHPIHRTVSHYYRWVKLAWENRSLETALETELERYRAGDSCWNRAGSYVGNSLYVEFLQHWLSIFSREQMLVLPSERLYEHPQATVAQVCQFLNVAEFSLSNYPALSANSYPPISNSLQQKLQDFFQPYNQKLADLLGDRFSQYW